MMSPVMHPSLIVVIAFMAAVFQLIVRIDVSVMVCFSVGRPVSLVFIIGVLGVHGPHIVVIFAETLRGRSERVCGDDSCSYATE